MIVKPHKFNSKWWGGNIGILDIDNLQEESDATAISEFEKFEWVEAKIPNSSDVSFERMHRLGFFYIDTQVSFRINLSSLEESPSLNSLKVDSGRNKSFKIKTSDIREFSSDRFSRLPGCSQEMAQKRYSLWSNLLIESSPQYSLRIFSGEKIQGYFLAQDKSPGFELTLAMLSQNSSISGMLLYQKALLTYRDLGKRVGKASFSVYNTPVMNIYSKLGASFTGNETIWIRKTGF